MTPPYDNHLPAPLPELIPEGLYPISTTLASILLLMLDWGSGGGGRALGTLEKADAVIPWALNDDRKHPL